jgi:hypothetical protein
MATTPTGKPSLKPSRGRSWKRLRRIEIVATLEDMFIPDAEIANHLGLTVGAIQAIKSTPEFLAKRISLKTGIPSVYDQHRLDLAEDQKQELNDLVPLSLTSVKRILLDPKHPHHAKIAMDILDRNQATSKISRTQHSVAPDADISKENQKANELLALLDGSSPVISATPTPLYKTPLAIDKDASPTDAEEPINPLPDDLDSELGEETLVH